MQKVCIICGKGQMQGHSVTRKGLAKKKGGTGKKTTRVTRRAFLPNLHKMRILLGNKLQNAYVCAKCLKTGKIQKA